ncbi:hypothetical protein L1887_24528 [Cichorium endivia]|nr:hypothetical protein L1887_24528 [Cichorium endivia]
MLLKKYTGGDREWGSQTHSRFAGATVAAQPGAAGRRRRPASHRYFYRSNPPTRRLRHHRKTPEMLWRLPGAAANQRGLRW